MVIKIVWDLTFDVCVVGTFVNTMYYGGILTDGYAPGVILTNPKGFYQGFMGLVPYAEIR